MSGASDYYDFLGVSPEATAPEIEDAYARRLHAWHPANLPPGAARELHDLAAERTRQLLEARATLLDPGRRHAYDEARRMRAPVPEEHAPPRPVSAAPAAPAAPEELAPSAPAVPEHVTAGRAVAWLALAGLLGLGAYALGKAGYEATGDEAYRYSTAVTGLVWVALMLALVAWITPGARVRDFVRFRPTWPRQLWALRPPSSWPWALAVGGGLVVAAFVAFPIYDRLFGPFEGDPTIATFWDGSRAPQFLLNLLVVAVLVPIQEELTYRGLGFAVLERIGTWFAIAGTGVLFALAHGYVGLLPIFVLVGVGLGWLRARTGSVYPGMLVHGAFNGLVTIGALVLG